MLQKLQRRRRKKKNWATATGAAVVCLLLPTYAFVSPASFAVLRTKHHSSLFATSSTAVNNTLKDSFDDYDERMDLNILLIDHYDSFTYNLADLLAQLCVRPPTVLAADCADSWDQLLLNLQQQQQASGGGGSICSSLFDGVVLSPGPGHPSDPICQLSRDCVAQNSNLPILGVCLGHQILGSVYGATVEPAPQPVHGQVKGVSVLSSSNDDALWKDIATTTPTTNKSVQVTRYHSLHVTNLKGTDLTTTAISDDYGVVMAVQHDLYPHFGVQFHPESIGTNATGKQLLYNFLQVCRSYQQQQQTATKSVSSSETPISFTERHNAAATTNEMSENVSMMMPMNSNATPSSPYSIYIHKVPNLPINGAAMHPLDVMEELLADKDYSFWLDESQATTSGQSPAVSILGASRQRVEYWGKEKKEQQQGLFFWNKDNECMEKPDCDILTFLQEQHIVSTEHGTMVSFDADSNEIILQKHSEDSLLDILPFAFRGGHVGYLGYEVRHDTARYLEEEEFGRHRHTVEQRNRSTETTRRSSSDPNVPTAAFLWADRSFVYDHECGDWYLVGVVSDKESNLAKDETLDWMRLMSQRLQSGKTIFVDWVGHKQRLQRNGQHATPRITPVFSPNRSRHMYNRNFDECIEHIRQGESYELCLTNQLEATVRGSRPLGLYSILRKRNPAPFSAFFNWNAEKRNEAETNAAVSICCSSPERFVSVKRQRNLSKNKLQVEAKPIKGTKARVIPSDGRTAYSDAERAQDEARANKLRNSVKDRAENLMIVDLLRNDLSRVCETGTVHVAKLMDIESFATVHQMVSTIRGTLNSSRKGTVDVLKACFPGGSMTGAPKLRTMELLDAVEEGVCRGPYSGCLGYISLNGSMDMNIVIRTAVLTPSLSNNADEWKVRIGAGGAITALSESADEYEEMMLKASAVMGAVKEWTAVSESVVVDSLADADFDYRQRDGASMKQGNMTMLLK